MSETVENPEAVLAELRRAQDDLKALRTELSDLRTAKEAAEAAVAEATNDNEWRNRALKSETKVALANQGIKDVDRLIGFVGTDGLDFDDDGKVTGLDERMKQLAKELPEVFDKKRAAGGKADIFSDNPAEPKPDPLREAVSRALS